MAIYAWMCVCMKHDKEAPFFPIYLNPDFVRFLRNSKSLNPHTTQVRPCVVWEVATYGDIYIYIYLL